MRHVRDARHADFERYCYLLLDFFGGAAGPLRDDVDVVVGDVGIGFHGKIVKGDAAPDEQQNRNDKDDEAIVE